MSLSLANIEEYLTDMTYPVYKNELIERARLEGAENAVLTALESISDRAFANTPDVIPELVEVQDTRRK